MPSFGTMLIPECRKCRRSERHQFLSFGNAGVRSDTNS